MHPVCLAQAFCTLLRLDPRSCAGLTVYAVRRGLLLLLAVMTGACPTSKRPFDDTTYQSASRVEDGQAPVR